MEITKVQVHIVRDNPELKTKVKAFCDIILDDIFIVKGLAVREDHEGYSFVTMPYRMKDGVRIDIAHPIKEKCRQQIEKAVLDEYENALNKMATNFDKMPYETPRPAA
jgi:DNA-binding cell septation regulator SpoVG